MKTQKVIICKGLPGSGKTTFAKKLIDKDESFKRISKDDLRIDNGRFSKANEKQILMTRDAMLLYFLHEGFNVIIDDTNLHPKHIKWLKELIKGTKLKVKVQIKNFKTPLMTCIKRDSKREKPVGVKVIGNMYNNFFKN